MTAYNFEGVESDGFLPAVFIGWTGQRYGELVFMPSVHSAYLCIDKDGNIMSPTYDANGAFINPQTLPEFSHRLVYAMSPGEVALLPATQESAMQGAVRSEQFAKLSFQTAIKQMYAEGKSGKEIHDFIKAQNGLIADPAVYFANEALDVSSGG